MVDTADGVLVIIRNMQCACSKNKNGLSATGKVDSDTLAAMKENNKKFAAAQQSRNVRNSVEVSRFGDRGRSVSDLQARLAHSGFSPGSIDGIFGNGTANALKTFPEGKRINRNR